MPYTKKPFGPALKKIRENKGYTQQEIADHSMSRSNYTKFELGTIQPTVVKYFDILNHLDISHEEFMYILNDYTYSEKEVIWDLFVKTMALPSLDKVEDIIEHGENYVEEQYDQLILNVLNSARASHALLSEKNMIKGKELAEKVWKRLEKLDKWYLRELYLINGILYLFDIETAESFTQIALEELDQYAHFEEAEFLRILYQIHLSSLLIAERDYEKALHYIDSLIEDSYEAGCFLEWAIALTRKGLCLQKMGASKEDAQKYFNRAKQFFHVLEREDLVEELEESPEQFKNIYVRIRTANV